jgi:hypothetical protein
MERVDVRLSGWWWVAIVVGGALTLGALWLAGPFIIRRWPRVLDDEGVTLRNGRRYAWSHLTDAQRTPRHGQYILYFRGEVVTVIPRSLAPRAELEKFVVAQLNRHLARIE